MIFFYISFLVFLRAKGLIIVIILPFFAGNFQRVWRNCWSISGIKEPSFLCNKPPNMMVRLAYKNVCQYQRGFVMYVFMWNQIILKPLSISLVKWENAYQLSK